jgi:hypothetical protein
MVAELRGRGRGGRYCDALAAQHRGHPSAVKARIPDAVRFHPALCAAGPRRCCQRISRSSSCATQLTVLRRQTPRPRLEPADRALLAAASRVLPRACWSCFFVKPETLLCWHRRLIAGAWTYPRRRLGRPQLDEDGQQLIVRLARENPRWGTTPPWHPDLGDHDPHDAAAPPAGPRATAGGHHLAGVSASTGRRDRRV